MDKSGGVIEAAASMLIGLPAGMKVLSASVGILTLGIALGAGGVYSQVDTVRSDALILTADVRRLERRMDLKEYTDSVRHYRLICVLTDGKDLQGIELQRMCNL